MAAPTASASSAEVPSPASLATREARLAAVLHYASLVVAFVVLALVNRHSWFGTDDFDFLANRGLHGAAYSIWTPHNEHWSTIPILIWRGLYSLVKLRTSFPYLVVNLLAHLAIAHLLWRTMRTMGVEPLVNAVLVVLFEFLGSGGEDIVRPFQIGFTGAVALGWLFILLENRAQRCRRLDVAAWVTSVVCLMFSGVSITMLAVGALVVVARRGVLEALRAVAPAFVVYALWYVLVGRRAYHLGRSLASTLQAAPAYVARGVTSAIAHTFSTSAPLGVGAFVAVLLALWLALRLDLVRSSAAPAFAGALGAVGFFVVNSFGRVQFGSIQATAPRYTYIAAALALPAIGLALSAVVDPGATLLAVRHVRAILAGAKTPIDATGATARNAPAPPWSRGHLLRLAPVIVVLGVLIHTNTATLLYLRTRFVEQSQSIEFQLVAAARVARTEPTIPNSLPAGELGVVNLTTKGLVGFARAGALPDVRPPSASVVAAIVATQYALTSSPIYQARRTRILSVVPMDPRATFTAPTRYPQRGVSPRCSEVLARSAFDLVTVAVTSPSSIELRSSVPALAFAVLRIGTTYEVEWVTLSARRPTWLDVAAPRSTFSVRISRGTALRTC